MVVALAYLELLSDPLWIAVAIAVSLLLGHLSYVLIEIPARQRLSLLSAGRAGIVVVVLLALAATVAQQVRRSGFPDRLPEAVAIVEAERTTTIHGLRSAWILRRPASTAKSLCALS